MTLSSCLTIDMVENIADAATPDAIFHGVKAIAASKGFERVVIWRNGAKEPVLFSSMTSAALAGFDVPPTIESKPYVLREFPCADALRAASDVQDGFVVPVCVAGVIAGAVVFAGTKPEMDGVARATLHVIAQCAIENIIRLESLPKTASLPLSPREIECLRLAADGKPGREIGRLLEIGPRTARFHLENAKRKLGVATRAQAIGEAMRRSLISQRFN